MYYAATRVFIDETRTVISQVIDIKIQLFRRQDVRVNENYDINL